ncbi:MAG: hypothetical protein ACI30B_05460 [Paludibacteraceae bacterium]
MKKLVLLSLLVCGTLCYAQDNDPFCLYKNPSSFSTSQKETTSNSETFEKEKKELLEKVAKLEAKLSDSEEKEVYDDKLKKINKQLLEQIKGLQIELSELKRSQKEWK